VIGLRASKAAGGLRKKAKWSCCVTCNEKEKERKALWCAFIYIAKYIYYRFYRRGKWLEGGPRDPQKEEEKTPSSDEMENLIDLLLIRREIFIFSLACCCLWAGKNVM
jgi:hypothetical protein